MLLVGGGAVNFHGYQRHSADVDFWIDTNEVNFEKLLAVFNRAKINILIISDLIESKIRVGRPKDLLDVQQPREINKLE